MPLRLETKRYVAYPIVMANDDPQQEEPGGSPQGRPRDPRVHHAILAATVERLRDGGYGALTIEGVARTAGVGKSTIYRRWENKGLLVYEALFHRPDSEPFLDTGTLAGDLRLAVDGLVAEYSSPDAIAALPGLLADFGADERLRSLIRDRFLNPVRAQVVTIFERAVERGEARTDVQVDLVVDALAGGVFFRVALAGEDLEEGTADALVEFALRGVMRGVTSS